MQSKLYPQQNPIWIVLFYLIRTQILKILKIFKICVLKILQKLLLLAN
jgi:hypothetical protein